MVEHRIKERVKELERIMKLLKSQNYSVQAKGETLAGQWLRDHGRDLIELLEDYEDGGGHHDKDHRPVER
jgi:hypothetical protein